MGSLESMLQDIVQRLVPLTAARQDRGEMSGTPPFAEPAVEMSDTRRGYTIVC